MKVLITDENEYDQDVVTAATECDIVAVWSGEYQRYFILKGVDLIDTSIEHIPYVFLHGRLGIQLDTIIKKE